LLNFQTLQNEIENNKELHASLISISESLLHLPFVARSANAIEHRWHNANKALQKTKEELRQTADSWKKYTQNQKNLERSLEEIQKKLSDYNHDVLSVDPQKLQLQQDDCRVFCPY